MAVAFLSSLLTPRLGRGGLAVVQPPRGVAEVNLKLETPLEKGRAVSRP
jgi:hypothetical protein